MAWSTLQQRIHMHSDLQSSAESSDGFEALHCCETGTDMSRVLQAQVSKTSATGPLLLSLPLTGIRNSVVVLSVKADSLRLVTNRCPGKIVSAKVSEYAPRLLDWADLIMGAIGHPAINVGVEWRLGVPRF